MQIQPLAYSPPLYRDETLWSWITRVALYHGWSGDEFLRLIGFGEEPQEGYFRQADVDCEVSSELLQRLAWITGFPLSEIASLTLEPSARTLWLDDRIAFCERCWNESAQQEAPYVRRVWLDTWCIHCPLHRCALVTFANVRRARRRADWNVAWASRTDWAQRTRAVCSNDASGLRSRGPSGIVRQPGITPDSAMDRGSDDDPMEGLDLSDAMGSLHRLEPRDEFEKGLVLLAGRTWGDFSLVRAFFNIRERIAWRNTAQGYDPHRATTEPLGSLTLRSGAIRIGSALADLLFERPFREPRIANPLRRWISDLYGKPRQRLLAEVGTWPLSLRNRWKRQFEWRDEHEWVRHSRLAAAPPTAGSQLRDSEGLRHSTPKPSPMAFRSNS